MIHHIDRALEQFLRTTVPLPAASVDISFRTPDAPWTAGLTRPTVDVFLWDLGLDHRARHAGVEESVGDSGGRRWRAPMPVVALRYLMTVWTSEHRDEHELLGAVLTAVLGHQNLPEAVLPDPLAGLRCSLALADEDRRCPFELRSSAGAKAAVEIQISIPVAATTWRERGPAVERVAAAVVHHDTVPASPTPSPAAPTAAATPRPAARPR
ncbi:MAG: Pvc16 family protein, partial [Actinomycetota bacterium]|nr:Pvc16 family protein [Actinomycetota bacterium]